jgi:hypothetical protein
MSDGDYIKIFPHVAGKSRLPPCLDRIVSGGTHVLWWIVVCACAPVWIPLWFIGLLYEQWAAHKEREQTTIFNEGRIRQSRIDRETVEDSRQAILSGVSILGVQGIYTPPVNNVIP